MGSSSPIAAITNVVNQFDLTHGPLNPKPPSPKKPPAPPPVQDATADAEQAAERQRKKNTSAYGRNDTILTGPQGTLGMMTTGTNTAPKTILGG